MKIYFEDGKLGTLNRVPVQLDDTVDATHGVKANIERLDELKKTETKREEELVIYTNSIFAFDNRYAWNEKLQVPEIYVRIGNCTEFERIDKLTAKVLKDTDDLAKMYINGEFKEYATEGNF